MGQTQLSVQQIKSHFDGTCPQPFPRRVLIEDLGLIAKEELEESEAAQLVLVSLLTSESQMDRFDAYNWLKELKRESLSTPDTDTNLDTFEADEENEEIWS